MDTLQIVRHGEVILKQIKTLPDGAKINKESNKEIIAHSETGHHHILEVKEKTDLSKMKFYTWNEETYIEVTSIAELWHQKSGKDVHTPHTINPGIYKVQIKKEFDYYAGIIRKVRD